MRGRRGSRPASRAWAEGRPHGASGLAPSPLPLLSTVLLLLRRVAGGRLLFRTSSSSSSSAQQLFSCGSKKKNPSPICEITFCWLSLILACPSSPFHHTNNRLCLHCENAPCKYGSLPVRQNRFVKPRCQLSVLWVVVEKLPTLMFTWVYATPLQWMKVSSYLLVYNLSLCLNLKMSKDDLSPRDKQLDEMKMD